MRTRERFIIVDEMRGAAKELSQFAIAPQELLSLVKGEVVGGGRGLREGYDGVSHVRGRGRGWRAWTC